MTIRFGSRVWTAMAMLGATVVAAGQSGRPLSAVELQERGLLGGAQPDAAVADSNSKSQVHVAGQDAAATMGVSVAKDSGGQGATGQMVAAVDAKLQPGESHVRIVRLSQARGAVRMDRKTGQGYEQTMANMPIVEGMKLETKAGTAEVEFEDGSTLRAAPDTVIGFPQLMRRATGDAASTVELVQGMMYVTLAGSKGSSFVVKAGGQETTMAPGTHLRLEMSGPKVIVAVFKGSAEVQAAGGMTVVEKKQTLTLGGDGDELELLKNVAKGPFDAWDKEANGYHEQNMRGNALLASGGGYGFGMSDLNYYGSFQNLGGCGQVWQPYFTSAAWSPYTVGAWAYYPGAGYSWVSPYPWGWLPYHTGQWVSCGGAGWGWRPGGAFLGLNNIAGLSGGGGYYGGSGSYVGPGIPGLAGASGQPQRLTNGPVRNPGLPGPPAPPRPGSATLVMQTRGPVTASGVANDGFVFQNNSAGLGVPRGELGRLNRISNEVQRNGAMAMPVEARSMVRGSGGDANAAFARGQVNLRPAGSAEARGPVGNNGNGDRPYRGGGNDGVRGPGAQGSGTQASGGQGGRGSGAGPSGSAPPPQRSVPPSPPPSNGGGYGGGGRGGGGMAPAQSAPAPAPAAAPNAAPSGRPR